MSLGWILLIISILLFLFFGISLIRSKKVFERQRSELLEHIEMERH